MKKRKQLYDRARKTQTLESWEAYRITRNQITQEISEAHTNYQTKIFENDTCTVSKRFWKYIKTCKKIVLEFLPWQQLGLQQIKVKIF